MNKKLSWPRTLRLPMWGKPNVISHLLCKALHYLNIIIREYTNEKSTTLLFLYEKFIVLL